MKGLVASIHSDKLIGMLNTHLPANWVHHFLGTPIVLSNPPRHQKTVRHMDLFSILVHVHFQDIARPGLLEKAVVPMRL